MLPSERGFVQPELTVIETERTEAQLVGPSQLFTLQLQPSSPKWSITLIQQLLQKPLALRLRIDHSQLASLIDPGIGRNPGEQGVCMCGQHGRRERFPEKPQKPVHLSEESYRVKELLPPLPSASSRRRLLPHHIRHFREGLVRRGD